MTRHPTLAGRALTSIGLALAATHLVLLAGIALFDDGRLSTRWPERIPWLVLVAFPGILGAMGLRNPSVLLPAALVSVPLSFISLAGATLPLLVPALFYVGAHAASARAQEQA